jgi:hypothetical protein
VVTRSRDGVALSLDAYFPDEAGLTYPNAPKDGAFLNKFTRLFVKSGSSVIEITQAVAAAQKLDPADTTKFDHLQPGTAGMELPNPLDGSVNPTVKLPETNIPTSARGHKSFYTAFAPPQLRTEINDLLSKAQQCPRPVRVALLFGTGSELGRHGLRAFIDKAFWRMIINVPGVEPTYSFAAGQRWGIGISTDQVRSIVQECFGRDVDFVVDRLIGFSTGYIGVTGTIRNQLVDLRNVEVLVFLDCNYGEDRVKDGIRVLKAATSQRVRVIAYASSVAGTPTAATRTIPLDVSIGGTAWLFGRRDFQALTHARVLASGLNDKTVDAKLIDSSIEPAVSALFAALPIRGSVVTDSTIHQLVHGRGPASGTQMLEAWYLANKANADVFLKALWNKTGSSPELARLIWKHKLPGWGGGIADASMDTVSASAFTEGTHDFVPFEFAWEVLT